MTNMENNNAFKYISVFLLGLILGYLLKGMNFSGMAVPTITEKGSDKVIGQENAPITMIEYSDFQCPLCKKFFDDTYLPVIKNYIDKGQIKYVMKHFPLNIHPQAPGAALASECALEQGKFWEMHDQLFQTQENWSGNPAYLDNFKKLAVNLGLNSEQFNQCLDGKTYQSNVDKDYQEGLTKAVRGTPTFYINDQLIVGAQDTKVFTDTIDQLLK
jgi:protein-disulfide isomerase